MKNKRCKKLQRDVNFVIRKLNENICADDLWQGRFMVRQKAAHIGMYEDLSGTCGNFLMEFVDKKTGASTTQWFDYMEILGAWFSRNTGRCGWRIWGAMNNFITDYLDVWNKENPTKERHDYTSDKRWSKK